MNNYLSALVAYFENLCVHHPELVHAEYAGRQVFEVVAYEDAFGDFRSAASEKGFFVRFILPTMRMERSGANARKTYQVGIMVGRYYSRREDGKAEMIGAWSDAERVADDFIARVVADSANGYSLFQHSADTVDALNIQGDFWDVQGDGSYAAVLYMFDIGVFRCVDPNGASYVEWTDGGLTE